MFELSLKLFPWYIVNMLVLFPIQIKCLLSQVKFSVNGELREDRALVYEFKISVFALGNGSEPMGRQMLLTRFS